MCKYTSILSSLRYSFQLLAELAFIILRNKTYIYLYLGSAFTFSASRIRSDNPELAVMW